MNDRGDREPPTKKRRKEISFREDVKRFLEEFVDFDDGLKSLKQQLNQVHCLDELVNGIPIFWKLLELPMESKVLRPLLDICLKYNVDLNKKDSRKQTLCITASNPVSSSLT